MMRRRNFIFVLTLLLVCIAGGYVGAAPAAQLSNLQDFIFDTRADLEVLANEALGPEQRPEGWTFNNDLNSQTVISDLWFDNELLANNIFGENTRPPSWIGITANKPDIIARNVRHDLELSASQALSSNTRPPEWRGAAPLLRCERTLQNVLSLLNTLYRVTTNTPESALNYCASVSAEAEENLVNTALDQIENLPDEVLAIRGDMERLADEALGLNIRPPNWIGNKDRDSSTLTGDNFLDLESLANQLLGNNVRPPGWIGVVTNSQAISYQNLRHDLELLADVAVAERPRGWQGIDPLERCDPLIQNLVILVEQFEFTTEGIPQGDNFCQSVAAAANTLAESPPIEEIVVQDPNDRRLAEADYAFTYLDLAARQYMGLMPPGVTFRAWYRNFGDSTMMFVSGDDFAVYLDQRWTTLPIDIYDSLPTLEGVEPLTFCDAAWCDGPGPTPTPTGSGPLILLLLETTPQAPVEGGEESSNKVQVSWNYIRVTYVADNATTRTAQVALEICTETTQINCEPVIRILDNTVGAAKPVISQTPNGLNVYEFPYGYTANLVVEGATLTSTDVWLSDPSIR